MMQEITGELILDGGGKVALEAPDDWTGEWVCERMIQGFEVLRVVGRSIGPKEYGSAWPEYFHAGADASGQGENWRRNAWEKMERSSWKIRPGLLEITLMEEAIAWPAEFIRGDGLEARLERDAVLLWTSTRASGEDVAPILRARYTGALRLARAHVAAENRVLGDERARAAVEADSWMSEEMARRLPHWAAGERVEKIEALYRQRERRLERALKRFTEARPRPGDFAGGRVITGRALRQHRLAGFDRIAAGLRERRAPVR